MHHLRNFFSVYRLLQPRENVRNLTVWTLSSLYVTVRFFFADCMTQHGRLICSCQVMPLAKHTPHHTKNQDCFVGHAVVATFDPRSWIGRKNQSPVWKLKEAEWSCSSVLEVSVLLLIHSSLLKKIALLNLLNGFAIGWKVRKSVFLLIPLTEGLRLRPSWHQAAYSKKNTALLLKLKLFCFFRSMSVLMSHVIRMS